MIGYMLQKNYLSAVYSCSGNSVRIGSYEAEPFTEFIKAISVDSDSIEHFIRLNTESKFGGLKQLEISRARINAERVEQMKPALKSVNILRLNMCEIEGSFYDTVLAHCSELTHLQVVSRSPNVIGNGNVWLLKRYSKLQHFALMLFNETQTIKLKTFLNLNQNVFNNG